MSRFVNINKKKAPPKRSPFPTLVVGLEVEVHLGERHVLTEASDDAAGARRTAGGEQDVRQQAGAPETNRYVDVIADPVLEGRFNPVLATIVGAPAVVEDRSTEVVVVLGERVEAGGKALRFIRDLTVVTGTRAPRTEVEHEVACRGTGQIETRISVSEDKMRTDLRDRHRGHKTGGAEAEGLVGRRRRDTSTTRS